MTEHRACLKAAMTTFLEEVVVMQKYISQHCQKFQYFKKSDYAFYSQPPNCIYHFMFLNHLHILDWIKLLKNQFSPCLEV